jgi:hypothetical protein
MRTRNLKILWDKNDIKIPYTYNEESKPNKNYLIVVSCYLIIPNLSKSQHILIYIKRVKLFLV